jgi:hypothetical protein
VTLMRQKREVTKMLYDTRTEEVFLVNT